MKPFKKLLLAVAVLLVLSAIGAMLYSLFSKNDDPGTTINLSTPDITTLPASTPGDAVAGDGTVPQADSAPAATAITGAPKPGPAKPGVPEASAGGDDGEDDDATPEEKAVLAWEDLAEELQEADFTADPALGRKVKAAFDAIKDPDNRLNEMQAMMNLISDGAVQALYPILFDTSYDADILDIIFSDILNRDDEVKYPMLEEIAKNKDHPNFADAAHILEVTKPDEAPIEIDEEDGGE